MEIAAGPGRRPAPAAGRAGVSSTTVSKPSIFSRTSGRVRPRAEDLAARSLDLRALYRPCPATRSAARSSTRCNVGATDRLDFTVISVGPRLTNQISGSPRWSPRGSTPGCCDSGLPWLAVGCLVLRWVSGRGRPGRRLHEIGAWPAIFRSSSITNCGSAGCSRSASTGPLLSSGGRQVFVPTGGTRPHRSGTSLSGARGRALDRRRFSVLESGRPNRR